MGRQHPARGLVAPAAAPRALVTYGLLGQLARAGEAVPVVPVVSPAAAAADLRERSPRAPWQRLGYDARARGTKWVFGRIIVISSLYLDAELPGGAGVGPQWLVTISSSGKRPTERQVATALKAFGLLGAEEDNHHPGVARHFWQPVDPNARVSCQCKADEEIVVEPDGYRWANPHPETGEVCRGCDLERLTGAACSLHPRENAS